ncbi:MAG: tetratricopeptide repeat protein [bacterium]
MGRIDSLIQYLGYKGVRLSPAAKQALTEGKEVECLLQGDEVKLSSKATKQTHKLKLDDGLNSEERLALGLSYNEVEDKADQSQFDEASKAQKDAFADILEEDEAEKLLGLIKEYANANRLSFEEAAKCFFAKEASATYIDYKEIDKRNAEVEAAITPRLPELKEAPATSPAKTLKIKTAKEATRAAFISQQTPELQTEIGTTFSSPAPKDYTADQLVSWMRKPQAIKLKDLPVVAAPASITPPPTPPPVVTLTLEKYLKIAGECQKAGDFSGAINALKQAQASTRQDYIKQGIQARIEKIELLPLAEEGKTIVFELTNTLIIQEAPLLAHYENSIKGFNLTPSNKEEYMILLSEARKAITAHKEGFVAASIRKEAVQLLAEGHYEPAIKSFESIPVKQRNINDWLGLGKCYEKLGDDEKAIAVYRQGIGLQADPTGKAILEQNIARRSSTDLPPPPLIETEEPPIKYETKKFVVTVPSTKGEFVGPPILIPPIKTDWFTRNPALTSASPRQAGALPDTGWIAWPNTLPQAPKDTLSNLRGAPSPALVVSDIEARLFTSGRTSRPFLGVREKTTAPSTKPKGSLPPTSLSFSSASKTSKAALALIDPDIDNVLSRYSHKKTNLSLIIRFYSDNAKNNRKIIGLEFAIKDAGSLSADEQQNILDALNKRATERLSELNSKINGDALFFKIKDNNLGLIFSGVKRIDKSYQLTGDQMILTSRK